MNNTRTQIWGAAPIAAGALLAITGQARAGCASPDAPKIQAPRAATRSMEAGAQFVLTGDVPATDAVSEAPAITGLWEFEFHLDGAQNGFADRALFDWGLATWHEDGTEIQFSAARTPAAGDICMGAWRQIGHNTYKLHHIALGLTPPDATGTFQGPAIIRATVKVDPTGETYTGPYSVSIYPGSPDNGTEFNESGTPVAVFSGTVTARRVTAN